MNEQHINFYYFSFNRIRPVVPFSWRRNIDIIDILNAGLPKGEFLFKFLFSILPLPIIDRLLFTLAYFCRWNIDILEWNVWWCAVNYPLCFSFTSSPRTSSTGVRSSASRPVVRPPFSFFLLRDVDVSLCRFVHKGRKDPISNNCMFF
jgi:hypothetical protein